MMFKLVRGGVDFYSGLLLFSIAAFALWYISGLEIGTARQMGPGYFPLGVALVLAAMGAFLLVRGMIVEGPDPGVIQLRTAALILLSFFAFAVLLDRFGLIAAILAQVALASFAARDAVFWKSMLFGLVLAVGSAALFVWGLGVQMRVLP
ncbi:tripartite tricarboxylate transporter TctB family protein [Xanthobacter sp. KR7-65]|uniref:tripartite tricarboxylate transporter TctB family protein n=1 Tax=Xanthobacter sp. KR7-65 TaxID=3156612 RepID=UPI0032B5C0B3